ncbi:ABC transporter substrate-binding protein, partial [Halorubrum sp. SS7]
MPSKDAVPEESTRRAFAKYGGTVALGGLLAGCTGGDARNDPSGSDGDGG